MGALFPPIAVATTDPMATVTDRWMLGASWGTLAALFLWTGFRAPLRGMYADLAGVVVTNMFRRYRVTWHELVGVSNEAVYNQGGGVAYHRLNLVTPDRRIIVDGVGGGAEPGGYLDLISADLLRMRDQAVVRQAADTSGAPTSAGVYLNPVTGEPSYWDGSGWQDLERLDRRPGNADADNATSDTEDPDPQGFPAAAADTRTVPSWKQLGFQVVLACLFAAGATAAALKWPTDAATVMWVYLVVAPPTAWRAVRGVREVGRANSWPAGTASVAMVVLVAGLVVVPVLTAATRSPVAYPDLVGSCQAPGESPGQFTSAECSSETAVYRVDDVTADEATCPGESLILDEGGFICVTKIRPIPRSVELMGTCYTAADADNRHSLVRCDDADAVFQIVGVPPDISACPAETITFDDGVGACLRRLEPSTANGD